MSILISFKWTWVQFPSVPPGFYLDRTDGPGRMLTYSIKSYSVLGGGEGARY